MTRRATFTQADLDRATKVAAARGWGVVVTKAGDIVLAPVEALPLPSPEPEEPDDPYGAWKAKREAKRARSA